MFYVLEKNVYWVKGAVRGCIYDFNSAKLYTVNRMLACELDKLAKDGICTNGIGKELKQVLQQLVDLHLLRLSQTHLVCDITEIEARDDGCKFAWIEITNKCNLKCVHCYNESDTIKKQEMLLGDYKKVIDNLQKEGITQIQIIGGEPFICEKKLKSMLDYSIDKFQMIEIFTNGTLITEEWYAYLLENKIQIALSLYSYSENEHDKVTTYNGSWRKTNEVIEKLKFYGIKYRVCNVLMKDVKLGLKTTDLYTLNPNKDVVRMSGRANFALLSDELIRKKLITKKTFQKPIKREFCQKQIAGHNCFKNKIYVASDLKVYPCVMERRMIHDTIGANCALKLNNTIRNLNKDKIEGCKKCEYRYACFDCRPDSLSGEFFEQPWYCTYNPLEGEWETENEFVEKLKLKWGTNNENKKRDGRF